jgi:hypothetical protein
MTRIAMDGISVAVPPGWDARIYRRSVTAGEPTHPVLHGANFGLPEARGDYGSGAVESMGSADVLVALLEFAPRDAGSALFGHGGLPEALDPAAFSTSSLQRALPGQAGMQLFLNQSGRAFCLYVVLGSSAGRSRLVPEATAFVRAITVGAAA